MAPILSAITPLVDLSQTFWGKFERFDEPSFFETGLCEVCLIALLERLVLSGIFSLGTDNSDLNYHLRLLLQN